jgi:hypothetical protein
MTTESTRAPCVVTSNSATSGGSCSQVDGGLIRIAMLVASGRNRAGNAASLTNGQTSQNAVVASSVTNSKNLVDEQDVGVNMCCNREAQSGVHPRGVEPNGRVNLLANLSKVDYLVEYRLHMASRNSQERCIKEDVLCAR